MENKITIWTIIFWVVTALVTLFYVFVALPKLSQNPQATGSYYLGSLIPNLIIIGAFWLLKNYMNKK